VDRRIPIALDRRRVGMHWLGIEAARNKCLNNKVASASGLKLGLAGGALNV
jgi:hypothetical protein